MKQNNEQIKKETEQLFQKLYAATSEEEQNKIANQIFEKNYDLVLSYARKSHRLGLIKFDDLVQVASLAMWNSIFSYQTEGAASFSLYAITAMNFAKKTAIKRQTEKLTYRLMKAKSDLNKEGNFDPTDEEIRAKMGVSRYLYSIASKGTASLDALMIESNRNKDNWELSLIDALAADDPSVVDVAIEREEKEELQRRIAELPERESYCIKRVVFEEATMEEIAKDLNTTRQTISRVYNSALAHLFGFSVEAFQQIPEDELLPRFDKLTEQQRNVMIKRCCEKKSVKETMEELGLSLSTVKDSVLYSLGAMTGITKQRKGTASHLEKE